MRQFLKIIRWILSGLLLLVVGLAATVYFVSQSRLHQRFSVSVQAAPLPTDAGALQRGQHVATTRGCLDCHGSDGGGGKVIDDPALGKIYGPNLTHDLGGLKNSYGNLDWVRAIRHGIGEDGRSLVLMPAMEYSRMSDDDLGSLIVYLESLPKVDRATVPVHLGPIGRALIAAKKMPIAAALIDHDNITASDVHPGINPTYGRYLAVGCIGCHNPSFSGGKIEQGPPDWPPASNLTAGAGSAVAEWSENDFITTLRTRRRPNGTELHAAMPKSFGQLDDLELKAIWSFLKTIPPKAIGQHD